MPTAYPDCQTLTSTVDSITRTRLVALTKLAKEIADLLDKKGLERQEHCVFGEIIQRMLRTE